MPAGPQWLVVRIIDVSSCTSIQCVLYRLIRWNCVFGIISCPAAAEVLEVPQGSLVQAASSALVYWPDQHVRFCIA